MTVRERRLHKLSSCSASVPLRQFNGDALWSFDEDQLTRVKVHDLVASSEAARSQSGDLGLDVVHGKADVVHAEFV